MNAAIRWMHGLGPKPDNAMVVCATPTFEPYYPTHHYSLEIDPLDHQCTHCKYVTDLKCERCEAPTCGDCFGMENFHHSGPSGVNYCIPCMARYNDRDFD